MKSPYSCLAAALVVSLGAGLARSSPPTIAVRAPATKQVPPGAHYMPVSVAPGAACSAGEHRVQLSSPTHVGGVWRGTLIGGGCHLPTIRAVFAPGTSPLRASLCATDTGNCDLAYISYVEVDLTQPMAASHAAAVSWDGT